MSSTFKKQSGKMHTVQWICIMMVLSNAAAFVRGDDPGAAKNSGDKTAEKTNDQWMEIKLRASQQILEGLTRADYQEIEKNARRMAVTNVLEKWGRNKQEFKGLSAYQGQLNAFEFATKELVRHAQNEDIDGALEAYVQLSKSCVQCHKVIRDVPAR